MVTDALELRRRLEGAWETLEAATVAFETAAKSLAREQPEGVAHAMALRDSEAVQRARDAVLRYADGEPALEALVLRYRTSRAELLERLHARTAELGIDEPSYVALASALEREPVLCAGRAVSWWPLAAFTVVAAGLVGVSFGQKGAVLALLVAGGLVAASLLSSLKLRVNARAFAIGAQVFKISEVTGVQVKRVERRTSRGGRTFEFDVVIERATHVDTVRLPMVPDGFTAALVRLGVPVSHG